LTSIILLARTFTSSPSLSHETPSDAAQKWHKNFSLRPMKNFDFVITRNPQNPPLSHASLAPLSRSRLAVHSPGALDISGMRHSLDHPRQVITKFPKSPLRSLQNQHGVAHFFHFI
jgi:hypothetical protein